MWCVRIFRALACVVEFFHVGVVLGSFSWVSRYGAQVCIPPPRGWRGVLFQLIAFFILFSRFGGWCVSFSVLACVFMPWVVRGGRTKSSPMVFLDVFCISNCCSCRCPPHISAVPSSYPPHSLVLELELFPCGQSWSDFPFPIPPAPFCWIYLQIFLAFHISFFACSAVFTSSFSPFGSLFSFLPFLSLSVVQPELVWGCLV